MIHYIKGQVTETMPGRVVIENNGIGYIVYVPDNSIALIADKQITLYTEMLVREDDISLYGFTDNKSLEMFNLLMTVNGVGAKAAMSILSALDVASLKRAIVYEDSDALTAANGIGKKSASRIVLELKDKVGLPDASDIKESSKTVKVVKGSAKDEALSGLIALGYTKSEALSFMSGIDDDSLTAAEYIKLALKSRR